MRRQRLIWFALGAGASAMVSVFVSWWSLKDDSRRPYLSVTERPFDEDELGKLEEIASTSGQLLRECEGAEFFMKSGNGPDQLPYSLIEISKGNDLAIHCVLERAASEGYALHIQFLTKKQAQVF